MSNEYPKGLFVLVGAAIVIGVYARLAGLGSRALSVDEYYFVSSVSFILEGGLPEFPSGGLYMRGVPQQYLTAAFAHVLGESGFAWRLQAVIFSLASVPLAFVYARRFVPPVLATCVAIVLLVSSWQIEFGRFARMYSAFQCTTLLFLILVDKAFFNQEWRLRYWPHVLAFGAVLTHALGVLLLPFLFIPVLGVGAGKRLRSVREHIGFAAVGVLTSLLCLGYYLFDFRGAGVENALPTEIDQSATHAQSAITIFPYWTVGGDDVLTAGLWIGLLALVVLLMRFMQQRVATLRSADILLILLVITAAGHLFTLSAAILVVLIVRYQIHRLRLHPPRTHILLTVSGVLATCWLGYAFIFPEWVGTLEGEAGLLRTLWHPFFRWPNLYHPVIEPGFIELPMISAMVVAALLLCAARTRRAPVRDLVRHPGFVIVYITFCLGLVPHSNTTRYVFHIYPVMLCLVAIAGLQCASYLLERFGKHPIKTSPSLAAGVLFLCLFGLTEDFNPLHLRRITSLEVAYRIGPFERHAMTWYPNQDSRSAAAFVNDTRSTIEHVRVIVDDLPPPSYYLEDEHAVYHPFGGDRFLKTSRERGTLDLWSNQRLLSTHQELRRYTEESTSLLIVRATNRAMQTFRVPEVWDARYLHDSRAFVSPDGQVEVVRVNLAPMDVVAPVRRSWEDNDEREGPNVEHVSEGSHETVRPSRVRPG